MQFSFRPFLPILLAFSFTMPVPVGADEISDALQAAVDAYAAGDLKTTSEKLNKANTGIAAIKSARLAVFPPEAP